MGPPNDTTPVRRLKAGLGVSWPVREYERASNRELFSINPILPLYSDLGPRRLLPKAGASENGELAPLFTVPLIRNPSAARLLSSSALWFENSSVAGVAVSLGCPAGVAAAFAEVAFTSVR